MRAPVTEVKTRSLYLGDEKIPLLYVSTPPGEWFESLFARMALNNGLPRFRPGRGIGPSGVGWQLLFDRLGPGDPAPLMSVLWPAFADPLVFGVRKASPMGWADRAVDAGCAALMIGPALDWPALVQVRESDLDEGGIMMGAVILDALGGRLAAAGIVPTLTRQP
ncbi:hypothetical protein AB0F17_28755 [Nonomuraea sp. NPDC026600]|uniref:hypothetical protein n=1 Tax=Nonomuraea sp. NPDC026600 TaxID=3155363 RepID=UPI0033F753E4